jgi:hypothetical protein
MQMQTEPAQMVRFIVVETIYPDLNPKFNVSVAYLRLIIHSVVGGVPSTMRRYLIDFMNLKIKSF